MICDMMDQMGLAHFVNIIFLEQTGPNRFGPLKNKIFCKNSFNNGPSHLTRFFFFICFEVVK